VWKGPYRCAATLSVNFDAGTLWEWNVQLRDPGANSLAFATPGRHGNDRRPAVQPTPCGATQPAAVSAPLHVSRDIAPASGPS
jgi:hypothetical protein